MLLKNPVAAASPDSGANAAVALPAVVRAARLHVRAARLPSAPPSPPRHRRRRRGGGRRRRGRRSIVRAPRRHRPLGKFISPECAAAVDRN